MKALAALCILAFISGCATQDKYLEPRGRDLCLYNDVKLIDRLVMRKGQYRHIRSNAWSDMYAGDKVTGHANWMLAGPKQIQVMWKTESSADICVTDMRTEYCVAISGIYTC